MTFNCTIIKGFFSLFFFIGIVLSTLIAALAFVMNEYASFGALIVIGGGLIFVTTPVVYPSREE